jgi:two-component system, NtrC family, response regulator HydG
MTLTNKGVQMSPNLRILIIDDDQRMASTLADILSLSGYEVAKAASGLQALEQIRMQAFDCVLTDVRMPGMDGVEFHRQLHQIQPGLPVVLMTAYAADERIRQGLEEGVVSVFDKPLDMTMLLGFFASLSKNHTVAIVDDDPAFCKTLGDILRQRGFGVTPITNPHLDVKIMAADTQVILLDMKLNSINGLDVLKNIRAQYPSLPVLLVTGYRQEMADTIRTALEFNTYTCLYKPLEIPHLLQILSEVQLKHLRGLLKNK